MKAVWYDKNGAADEVLCFGEMAQPDPQAGEVLVRLFASGVNPSDVKKRSGAQPMGFERVVPHSDGAGDIVAVGAGVDRTMVGRRVFVRNGQFQRALGTAAEFIALPAGLVHSLPEKVDYDVGAGLGIPAVTAAYAVLKDGPVDGMTLLIHGAGGTVARLAVQIAVDAGAQVIATTGRSGQHDYLRDRGAAAVIDYRDPEMAAQILSFTDGKPVQRIIDSELGSNLGTSLSLVGPKGHIIGYGSVLAPKPQLAFLDMMFKNITLSGILVYLLEEDEAEAYASIVSDMLENDRLDVPIETRLPLAAAAQAHQMVEAGPRKGAVVLTI